MKALVAEAEWNPRKGYPLTAYESKSRSAIVGSQVWQNPRFEIKNLPTPVVRDDELLIRVAACGICGSDTHTYETDSEGYILFPGLTKLPCVLGHEFSGEVVEVGQDVREFEKGDLITSESIMWCGKCLPCRSGMLNQCENIELMGLSSNGAFAEFVSVKEKYCWKLNGLEERFGKQDIVRIGTLIEPIGCAYNGIFISGHGYVPGAYAVVYGAGPIGLGAVLLLKAAGAAKIIAVDVVNERLEIAKQLGADYVFNFNSTKNLEEAILGITSGWGANIQVEAAGARDSMRTIQKLLAKRGKVVYLGRAEASVSLELNSIVSGAIGIVGSRGHSGYGIFSNIIRLLQGGRLDGAQKIITARFPFSEIMHAFAASTKRTEGKILVDMLST